MSAPSKIPEPFGIWAFLVQPSGFGAGTTFTRQRVLPLLEATWAYYRRGGNGEGHFWIEGDLLNAAGTVVNSTAVDDEWEIVLELRPETDTAWSTWYRGVIKRAEKKTIGTKNVTEIWTLGYWQTYMGRVVIDRDDTTTTNDVKTLLSNIFTVEPVTAQSRVLWDATLVDASTYTPSTFDSFGPAGRPVRVLADVQGSRDYDIIPSSRKFRFITSTSTVAERNVYLLGKHIKEIKDAFSQERAFNEAVIIGHPRNGNPIKVTRSDATAKSADGQKNKNIFVPELAATADLNRWADNVLGDFKVFQSYSVVRLNYVKDRVESDSAAVGKIRIWRKDGSNSPSFTDYALHKVIYHYSNRQIAVQDVPDGTPEEARPADYALTATLFVGFPPLELAEMWGQQADELIVQKFYERRNTVPAVVAGGGTSYPSARRWQGLVVMDSDDGSVETYDGTGFESIPNTNDATTWTGQQTIQTAGVPLTLQNTTDAASNQVLILKANDRVTPAANDTGYISLYMDDSTGTSVEFARLTWRAATVTSGAKDADIFLSVYDGNSFVDLLQLTGASSLVDVKVGGLQLSGAQTLLELVSGYVKTTHVVTTEPAAFFAKNANIASNPVLRLQGHRATTAQDADEAYVSFYGKDDAGNQDEFARLTWIYDDVSSTTEDCTVRLGLIKAGVLTNFVDFIGTGTLDLKQSGSNVTVAGANTKHTIMLSAAGGKGTATAGAGDANKFPESRELATNDENIHYLAFDQTTSESAFWLVQMPDNYDGGTVTARFIWTAASGSGTVTWQLRCRSYADDEALDQAQGTRQAVTDTLLAADDVHISAATSAITAAGTPAGGELMYFEVNRDIADTLNADAQLLAVQIEYGVNAFSA